MSACKDEDQLSQRIRSIATDIAPEYPFIDRVPVWECLYAIECTYNGQKLALADWESFARELAKRLGMDEEATFQLWDELITEKERHGH